MILEHHRSSLLLGPATPGFARVTIARSLASALPTLTPLSCCPVVVRHPKGPCEDMTTHKEGAGSLADSLKLLLEAERLSSENPENVNLRQVVISGLIIVEHARVYCPSSDDQLRDIEQRLAELEKRSTPPSGLQTFISALIRIAVATIAGAAIGAPLGAWLVHDEIAKEVVKAAIAASISQTCMEVAQAGLDRRPTERNASRSDLDLGRYSSMSADYQAQELGWGSGHYPHGSAAGDDDARAR